MRFPENLKHARQTNNMVHQRVVEIL